MTDNEEAGLVESLIRTVETADIYLRLSLAGLFVFVVLCCMICCAWHHYGSVISTVFDQRS